MKVFLARPIDYWWNENWHTPMHYKFLLWHAQIGRLLVEAGHSVYFPDQAFKGAWDEVNQEVNDFAIKTRDVFIFTTPPGVPAYGTRSETELAVDCGLEVYHVPPGHAEYISHLLVPLDDPYSDVYRKSYTKEK